MGLGQSHRFHAGPILRVRLAKVDEGEAVPGGDDDVDNNDEKGDEYIEITKNDDLICELLRVGPHSLKPKVEPLAVSLGVQVRPDDFFRCNSIS